MVYIVTGSINSGKTSKLLSIYNGLQSGDGFILPKIFKEGDYAGQNIVRLSTGESHPFSFKKMYIPSSWKEKYRYDIYSFSKAGVDFAYSVIGNCIKNKIYPVFIDEIGPLEIEGKGFYEMFLYLLHQDLPLYVSIRQNLLECILKSFCIEKFRILSHL